MEDLKTREEYNIYISEQIANSGLGIGISMPTYEEYVDKYLRTEVAGYAVNDALTYMNGGEMPEFGIGTKVDEYTTRYTPEEHAQEFDLKVDKIIELLDTEQGQKGLADLKAFYNSMDEYEWEEYVYGGYEEPEYFNEYDIAEEIERLEELKRDPETSNAGKVALIQRIEELKSYIDN